jgi:hypothetical protein
MNETEESKEAKRIARRESRLKREIMRDLQKVKEAEDRRRESKGSSSDQADYIYPQVR